VGEGGGVWKGGRTSAHAKKGIRADLVTERMVISELTVPASTRQIMCYSGTQKGRFMPAEEKFKDRCEWFS